MEKNKEFLNWQGIVNSSKSKLETELVDVLDDNRIVSSLSREDIEEYQSFVEGIAISPSWKYQAVWLWRNTILLKWKGLEKRILLREAAELYANISPKLIFNPDNENELIYIWSNGTVRVYDILNQEDKVLHKLHDIFGSTFCVDWNSSYIVSGDEDERLFLYDRATGNVNKIFEAEYRVSTNSVCLWKEFVLFGLEDGKVMLYDFKKDEVNHLYSHSSTVCSLSMDGYYVVSSDTDGKVKLYNIRTNELKNLYEHSGSAYNVKITGSQIFSVGSDWRIKYYNIKTNEAKTLDFWYGQLNTLFIWQDHLYAWWTDEKIYKYRINYDTISLPMTEEDISSNSVKDTVSEISWDDLFDKNSVGSILGKAKSVLTKLFRK